MVPRFIAVLVCAALVASASAKDPYKAKDLRTVLAADTGIDASKILSTRVGRCALVDPNNLYYEYGAISAPFRDCLVVEFADAVEIFYFRQEYIRHENKRWEVDYSDRGWREMLRVTPQTVRGVKMAERGKKIPLRQIQVEQLDGSIFVIEYAGGLIGDHKYPLVAIVRLTAMGLPGVAGIDHVMPVVPKNRTITIYQ